MSQLNPNLTPAELEAGAKQALLGITNDSGESIELTSDYFKSLYTSDELYKIAEKNNLVIIGVHSQEMMLRDY